jgi:hypothetical protein
LPDGQITCVSELSVPPRAKNKSLRGRPKLKLYISLSHPHHEGRFAIVTDVGMGCGGRDGVVCAVAGRFYRERSEARETNGTDPPSLKLRRDWYQARRAAFSKGERGNGFGPFERRVRASPFPIAAKASVLVVRPHGRSEVSMSKRPSIVQAFGARSTYYALC